MFKKAKSRSIFTLLLTFSPLCWSAEPLRLLNWEDYLSPDLVEEWEEGNGPLQEIYFDSDQDRDAIIVNSERHHVDVVVVDEIVAQRFGADGKFLKLDEANLPSLKDIEPFWRQRCGDYAMPYLWGTLGIAYRSDKLDTPPRSWYDLLRPAENLRGHIAMINDYTDMLAPALFYLGYDLNTDNREQLKQAFEMLKKQASDVLTYDYAITYAGQEEKLKNLYMAAVYGGDQYSLNELDGEKGRWEYVVPEEGTVLWVDCLAIIKESPKRKQSLSLLAYLNTAKAAAENSVYNRISTPNLAAVELMNKTDAKELGMRALETLKGKAHLYRELSNQNVVLRLKIINAIMNIHESKNSN